MSETVVQRSGIVRNAISTMRVDGRLRDQISREKAAFRGFEIAIAQDHGSHNPPRCGKKTSGSHREKRSKQLPAPMVNRALTSPSLW
jgi:hypothetical protein